MPQQTQVRYHPAQTRSQESQRAEMDALEAADVEAANKRVPAVTAEDADDWLESIDDAIKEWAESDEMARAFVADFRQKGGQ